MIIHPAVTAAIPLTATTVSTGSGVDAAIAWGGVVASLLMAAGLFLITWRQLNGRHRRWVVDPGIPFQISNRNTWPLALTPDWYKRWARHPQSKLAQQEAERQNGSQP